MRPIEIQTIKRFHLRTFTSIKKGTETNGHISSILRFSQTPRIIGKPFMSFWITVT
ncbi:prophage protein (plasmid) [Acetobacter orientalis]|uniref:Prophage protein n=1 Tax=Acetobacter orientalis TaxID=146474 RepID=A0A2Z5ZME7_9PROT|nr:prophage protein [Acetobacter orientalis]